MLFRSVDQPSTLVFTLSSDERWTNGPVMSFNVYVDGKLAYKHNGETYRYSVDRYWNYVLHGSYDYPSYRPYGSEYYYETNYITDLNHHFVDIESGNHSIRSPRAAFSPLTPLCPAGPTPSHSTPAWALCARRPTSRSPWRHSWPS